jgi:hypothetical protein
MKRFRRGLFNGLAALSLLLCAATLAVYPWTHERYRIARFSRVIGTADAPTWECVDFDAKPLTLEMGMKMKVRCCNDSPKFY